MHTREFDRAVHVSLTQDDIRALKRGESRRVEVADGEVPPVYIALGDVDATCVCCRQSIEAANPSFHEGSINRLQDGGTLQYTTLYRSLDTDEEIIVTIRAEDPKGNDGHWR